MDIENFCIERGKGYPFVLLHGNDENSSYFNHQLDFFSDYYHVYAIDTRGHGNTPRGNAPFTIRQFAEDLKAFFDGHEIKKAHVLGFSDGGNIAMVFAINHPECVGKLVLNGANMNATGVKRTVQIPIEIGYRIAKMFANKSSDAKRNAEMLGLMVNDPNVTPGQLSLIQAPTLVIAGTKDMIKASHTEAIARCIPQSTLVFISGDHFIARDNPGAFNQAVFRFLNDSSA